MPDLFLLLILAAFLWVLFGAVYGALVMLRLIDAGVELPKATVFWMYVVAGLPGFAIRHARPVFSYLTRQIIGLTRKVLRP